MACLVSRWPQRICIGDVRKVVPRYLRTHLSSDKSIPPSSSSSSSSSSLFFFFFLLSFSHKRPPLSLGRAVFFGRGGAVAPFVSLSNRLRFPNRALVIGRRKSTVPNGLPRNYAALFYHHLGWLCPREGDHLGSDLFPFIRLFVRFQWVFCGHSAMVAANYKTTHFFTGFSVIQVKARKLLFYIIGGNLIKLAKFTVSIITLFRVFSFRQCKHFLSHGILLLHYSLQCQV